MVPSGGAVAGGQPQYRLECTPQGCRYVPVAPARRATAPSSSSVGPSAQPGEASEVVRAMHTRAPGDNPGRGLCWQAERARLGVDIAGYPASEAWVPLRKKGWEVREGDYKHGDILIYGGEIGDGFGHTGVAEHLTEQQAQALGLPGAGWYLYSYLNGDWQYSNITISGAKPKLALHRPETGVAARVAAPQPTRPAARAPAYRGEFWQGPPPTPPAPGVTRREPVRTVVPTPTTAAAGPVAPGAPPKYFARTATAGYETGRARPGQEAASLHRGQQVTPTGRKRGTMIEVFVPSLGKKIWVEGGLIRVQ